MYMSQKFDPTFQEGTQHWLFIRSYSVKILKPELRLTEGIFKLPVVAFIILCVEFFPANAHFLISTPTSLQPTRTL